MTDTPEETEALPEIELIPPDDCLIECDDCIIGLAGGVDQFCDSQDSTAIRIHNKGGKIEALDILSRTWREIGRAGSGKISAITKEPKP